MHDWNRISSVEVLRLLGVLLFCFSVGLLYCSPLPCFKSFAQIRMEFPASRSIPSKTGSLNESQKVHREHPNVIEIEGLIG